MRYTIIETHPNLIAINLRLVLWQGGMVKVSPPFEGGVAAVQ
jgi:hypothetical protein